MSTSRVHLATLAVTVTLGTFGLASPALAAPGPTLDGATLADTACESPQLRAQVVEILAPDRDAPDTRAAIDLPLHIDVTTTARIDARVTLVTSEHLRNVTVAAAQHSLTFHAEPSRATERGIVNAKTTGRPFAFALRTVADPAQAVALAIVRRRTLADADAPAVTVLGSVCSLMTQLSAQRLDPFSFLTEQRGIAAALALFDSAERIEIADPDPGEQGAIVRATHWAKLDERTRRVLRFYVANRSDRAYELASLQLLDERGQRNHAAQAWLETGRVADAPIILEPGAHIEGWLWVDDIERLGRNATLAISEPQGKHPRTHERIPVWERQTSEKDSEIRILQALHDALLGHNVKSAFLRELVSEYERIPIDPRVDAIGLAETARDVSVRATAWYRSPRHLILAFDATNNDAAPFLADQLAVLGERDARDHAGAIFLGAARDRDHFAIIPPRSKVSGLVFVHDSQTAGDTVALYLRPATGAPVMQTRIPVIDLTPPKTPEEIRDEKARGRVAVHLQAIGGIIWLESGIDGSNTLSPASLMGLGVRATYSFNRFVRLEVIGAGASSGGAEFREVSIDGMNGDVIRSTKLGRLQGAGMVGFGERNYSYLKLGVGAQLASNDSQFMSGGIAMPGPGASVDSIMMMTFGVGIDLRLGDHVTAGASVSWYSALQDKGRSLEFGAYLGYDWKP